jgi:hypothetical protein
MPGAPVSTTRVGIGLATGAGVAGRGAKGAATGEGIWGRADVRAAGLAEGASGEGAFGAGG